ncbi:MAG: hypothetical protein OXU43_06415 [Gammaproteobacteria bacterium]|nr:hypothetical protein [Gammaproteobacteria bacterium]
MKTKHISTWLSFTVAVLALTLSQLPPIPSYFASPDLSLTVKGLRVNQFLGNLLLHPFLQINNSGKSLVTVSKIELILTKQAPPVFEKTFSAEFYQEASTLPYGLPAGFHAQTPFGNIVILPDEVWNTYVHFQEKLDDATRIQHGKIMAKISSEALENYSNGPFLGPYYYDLSDELFREFKSRSDALLNLFLIGQYNIRLKVFDDSNLASVTEKCYSFTVFDGHLDNIKVTTAMQRIHPQGRVSLYPLGPLGPLGQKGFYVELVDMDCAN